MLDGHERMRGRLFKKGVNRVNFRIEKAMFIVTDAFIITGRKIGSESSTWLYLI